MKITRIECLPINFPLRKPFTMSGFTVSCIFNVLIKIHTDDGIVGIGETGDMSPWYQGESQDSVMSLVQNIFGPQILMGEDPFNIEKIVAKMDYAVRYNNQAKALVDFALHDAVGKKLGVPVYKLLGGRTLEKIPLMKVLGASSSQGLVLEAKEALKAGFKSIKIKVAAHSAEEDVENVKSLREALGPGVRIMIDANAGWHYNQALEILKQMEDYKVFFCEQPLPWWDVNGMARLRKQVRVPIFADESAQELKQVLELIEKEAVDGFLIKFAKAGGFLKSQKWVTLAKVAGLPVTSGCFKGSGVEAAAYAHFLAATEWMSKVDQADLGPLENYNIMDTVSVDIKTDLVKKLPRYENGYVYPPEGPGLGVELNDEVVTKMIAPGKKPIVIS
jgi:L-alanine-DL-glutamate epimerase-like enolase superfamily enzyme